MSEGDEIRATHEEVEAFVGRLRELHDELAPSGQAMLATILDSARGGEEPRSLRYKGPEWDEVVEWIEAQGGGEGQGFLRRLRGCSEYGRAG